MTDSEPDRAPLSPQNRLEAVSLYLQPPSLADMGYVRWLWADPETMGSVGGPVHLTDEQSERWYVRMIAPGRQTDCFCLIRLLDGSPVGEISFHRLNTASMVADLNVKVMASARGRGIGREALGRFTEYFFREFGGHALRDDVAPANRGGQEVLAHVGFRRVPGPDDVVRFELTAQEYEAARAQS
jgi:RimJ/RimL family protein N-acetyltransferase